MCARYNPMTGTCQLRKTSASLEQVLLARCLENNVSSESSPIQMLRQSVESRRVQVVIHDETGGSTVLDDVKQVRVRQLVFHGVTGGNVVLGHVKFVYECGTRTAAFTLDLETLFDTLEPAALHAAINFPLNSDILSKRPRATNFSPYYTSSKHGTSLAGLISVEGATYPERASIYSFKTAMDWQ